MADERVETCLTCESAVGFGSSQSLGSPGSHETPTGRFGSMGAAPRSEAQQVPKGKLAWWELPSPTAPRMPRRPFCMLLAPARVGQ